MKAMSIVRAQEAGSDRVLDIRVTPQLSSAPTRTINVWDSASGENRTPWLMSHGRVCANLDCAATDAFERVFVVTDDELIFSADSSDELLEEAQEPLLDSKDGRAVLVSRLTDQNVDYYDVWMSSDDPETFVLLGDQGLCTNVQPTRGDFGRACFHFDELREAVLRSQRFGSIEVVQLPLDSTIVDRAREVARSDSGIRWKLYLRVASPDPSSEWQRRFELREVGMPDEKHMCGIVSATSGTPMLNRPLCAELDAIKMVRARDSRLSPGSALAAVAAVPVTIVGATVMLAAGSAAGN